MLDCDLLRKAAGTARSLSSGRPLRGPVGAFARPCLFRSHKAERMPFWRVTADLHPQSEIQMIRHILFVGAMALAMPVGAHAQGVPDGAAHGARVGEHDAGPIGAVVGGVVGGIIGGVDGVLGIDDRPRFHRYVADRHYPSYEYPGEIRVGAVLPDGGVTYYEVPPEYSSAREYRYTIINGHTVLVDPRTHTIIQIVD
jgi:hypothetical protein